MVGILDLGVEMVDTKGYDDFGILFMFKAELHT